MSVKVELYFDVVCPYAYLAHTRIEAVCERHGAELEWRPILLGGLFRTVRGDDGPMTGMAQERARMNLLDMHRWADHWGVPFAMPAQHPRRTVLAMRAIVASESIPRAAKALFAAYWRDGVDVADPERVERVLAAAGLDGAAIVAKANEQAIKDELRARTDEAAAAGVFGVPTFAVRRGGAPVELFWGQDRLDLLERALDAASGPRLTFFFDYSSPFAYLAATQVERIATTHGAHLVWQPFLLGGLFKAIGTANVPLLTMPPAKQRYLMDDMRRHADLYGVPFRFPSRFPMRTLAPLRMTLQLSGRDRARFALAVFRAYWADDRDISAGAELVAIANDLGLDGERLLAGSSDAAIKDALRQNTDRARQSGVCGAPSFLVQADAGDEGVLFWGQDRLRMVEKALGGWRPPLPA